MTPKLGALIFAALIDLTLASLSKAQADEAIAMHGAPALASGFTHFPYADPGAPKGGRLRLCLLGTFDSLNPFNLKAGSTAQGLGTMVFETLMARSQDEPFTLYGLIAESMDTDDARSFATFHLDPKARFSDGSPITSSDVRFTFDLLRSKGRPQQRAAFAHIKAVTTADPETIRFDLEGTGDRELPLFLGLMPVLSSKATDAAHFDETTLKPPLASGPYRVGAVEPGQKLVLERNPDYWARDLPTRRGMFNFDRVDIDYYRDTNALFEVFKAGQCDFRIETDPARWLAAYDFPNLRDGRDVKVAIPLRLPKGMDGFAFNTRRAIFADVRVREALGDMFDFGWVNRNLYGGLYRRTPSFFAESPAGVDRAGGLAGRDGLVGTLPRCGAGRRPGRKLAPIGRWSFGSRPGRREARPGTFGRRGRPSAGQRHGRTGRPADPLRDRRTGSPSGAVGPELCRHPAADRHRGYRAARRRGPVPTAPTKLRFRHDVGVMVGLALARCRAALAVEFGQRRAARLF